MNGSLHNLFEMAAARDWYSSPGTFLYDHRQASAADYESTFRSDPSANFTLPSSMVTPSIHPAFPTDPYHSLSIMNAVMSPPMPPLPSLESPTGNHYGNAAIPSPFSPTWSHAAGNNPQYDSYLLHAKDEQLRRMQSNNSQRCAVSDYSSFLSPGHLSTSFAVPAWNSGLPAVTNGHYSPYYPTASLNYQTGDGFGAYRSQPSHYGASQNFETDLTPIERLSSLTSDHATALPASQHNIPKQHENYRSVTRKMECMAPAQKQLMPADEMRGRYFMTKDAVSLAEKLQIDVWNHDVISHAYPGTGQVSEWDYRCAMSASSHHSLTSQSSVTSGAGLGDTDTQHHSTSNSGWNAIYAPGSSSMLPVISTSAHCSVSCCDLQMSGGQQLPAIQSLTSGLRRSSIEDRNCTAADYGHGIETSSKSCTAVYKPVSRPWSQTTQPSTTTCFTSPVITASVLNRSVAIDSHSCSEQVQSGSHREKMNASQYSKNVAETSEFRTKADSETTPVLQEKLTAIINREARAAQGESKTVEMEKKNEEETAAVNSSGISVVVVSDKSLIVEPVSSVSVAKNLERGTKSYPGRRTSVDSNLGTTVVSGPECQQSEPILNGLLGATVNNSADGPDSQQQTSAETGRTSPKSASHALTAANGARNVASKASRLSHILQAISNRKSQLQQQQLGEPCTSEQQSTSVESETHHSDSLPVNPPTPAVSDTTPSIQPLHPRSVLRTQRAQSLTTNDGVFLLPPDVSSTRRHQPASRLSRSISTDERQLARIAKNIINNVQTVAASQSQELQKSHRVEILSQSDAEVFRHPHNARVLSRSVSADGRSMTSALKRQTPEAADDIVLCDLTDDTEDVDLPHPPPGTVSTTGQESYQRNLERQTKLHHSSSNGSIKLPSVYSSDMDERLMESSSLQFTPTHGVVQRLSRVNETSYRICSEYLMKAGLVKNSSQLISVRRLRPQMPNPGFAGSGTESVVKNTSFVGRGRPRGIGNIPGTRMRSLLPRSHSFEVPLRKVHFVHSTGKASRTADSAEQSEVSSGIDIVKSIIEREFQQSRSVNSDAHGADVIDVDSDQTEKDTAVVDTNCVETDVDKSAEIGKEKKGSAPAESADDCSTGSTGNEASLLLLKMKQQAFKTPNQSLRGSGSHTPITMSANHIGSRATAHAPHSIARLLSMTDTRAIAARRAPFHRIRPTFGIGNQLRLPGVPHKFTLPPPLHRSATTSRLPGLRGASIANQNFPYQQQWMRGMTVKKQLILSDLYALKKASSCVIDLTDDDDDREPTNCEEAFARLRKKSGFRRPYHRTMGRRASLADGSCCDVRRRCVPVNERVRYAIDRSLPFYRCFVQFLLKQFRFNSAGMPARIIPELEAVLQAAEAAAAAVVPDSQTSSRSRSLSSDSSGSSDEEDEEMDWSKLIEEKRLQRQKSAAAREEIRSCAVLLENIEPNNLKLDAESAKKSEGSYPGLEMICGKIADLIKSKVTSDMSMMKQDGSDSAANLSSGVDHTNAVGNAKPLWPLFLAAKNREVPKAAEPADQMSDIADEQCMKTKEKRKRSSTDGKAKHRKSRSIDLKSCCRPLSVVVERLSDERIEQLSSDLHASYPPDDSPDLEKPHIVIKISTNVAQLCVAQLQETLQNPSSICKLSIRPGPASSKHKRLGLLSKKRIDVASSEQLNLSSAQNPPAKDRQPSRPGPASSKRKTRGLHSKDEIKVASVEPPAFPVIETFSSFSPAVELEQNLPATAETNVAPVEDAASAAVELLQTSGVVSCSVPISPLPPPVPSPERQLRAYRCIRPMSSVPRAPKKCRVNSKLDSLLPTTSTSDAPSPSVILASETICGCEAVNSDVVFKEPKQQDVQCTSTTTKFETDAVRVPEPSVTPYVTDASDTCLAADLDVNPSVIIKISKKRTDPPMDAACEIVDTITKRPKKSKKLKILTVAEVDQPSVIAAEPATFAVVAATDSREPMLKKPRKIKKLKSLTPAALALPDEPKPAAEEPKTVAQVVLDSAVPGSKMVTNLSAASSSSVLPKYCTEEPATAAEVGLDSVGMESSIEKPKKAKKSKNSTLALPGQTSSIVEEPLIITDEVASDNVEYTLNEPEIARKLENATLGVSGPPKLDADETAVSDFVEPDTMKKPKKSRKLKNSSVVMLDHPGSTSEEPMAVTVVALESLEPSLKKPKKTKKSKNSILPMSDQPKSTTEEPVIVTGVAVDCSEPTVKKSRKTKRLKNSSLPVPEQQKCTATESAAVAEVEPNAKKRKKTQNASITVSEQPKPVAGKATSASKLKNTSTKKNKIVQKNAILNYFKPISSLGVKNSSVPRVPVADPEVLVADPEVPVADSPVSVASSTATVSYPPSPVCIDSAVASLDLPDNPLELTVLTADDVFKALQIGLNDYALDGNPAPSRKSDAVSVSIGDKPNNDNGFEAASLQNAGASDSGGISQSLPCSTDDGLASGEESEGTVDYEDDKGEPSFPVSVKLSTSQTVRSELTCEQGACKPNRTSETVKFGSLEPLTYDDCRSASSSEEKMFDDNSQGFTVAETSCSVNVEALLSSISSNVDDSIKPSVTPNYSCVRTECQTETLPTELSLFALEATLQDIDWSRNVSASAAVAAVDTNNDDSDDDATIASWEDLLNHEDSRSVEDEAGDLSSVDVTGSLNVAKSDRDIEPLSEFSSGITSNGYSSGASWQWMEQNNVMYSGNSDSAKTWGNCGYFPYSDSRNYPCASTQACAYFPPSSSFDFRQANPLETRVTPELESKTDCSRFCSIDNQHNPRDWSTSSDNLPSNFYGAPNTGSNFNFSVPMASDGPPYSEYVRPVSTSCCMSQPLDTEHMSQNDPFTTSAAEPLNRNAAEQLTGSDRTESVENGAAGGNFSSWIAAAMEFQ